MLQGNIESFVSSLYKDISQEVPNQKYTQIVYPPGQIAYGYPFWSNLYVSPTINQNSISIIPDSPQACLIRK